MVNNNKEDFFWVNKYGPKTLDEVILPSKIKVDLKGFVKKGEAPNFLFVGPKGIGKTATAKNLVKALGGDCYYINASLKGNIDTLRNEITQFASTTSLNDGRKYVILDEADGTTQAFQQGLRAFMEEYSENCSFILTANFQNKLIEPLWSRSSVIEFKIPASEMDNIKGQMFEKIIHMLTSEGIEFDELVVFELVDLYFPDWRRLINELQRYSVNGVIDSGILSTISATTFAELIAFMKDKDFTNVRKWVAENASSDANALFKMFYDQAKDLFKLSAIPELVIILADYQYKSAFVVNQDINTAACFCNIMVNCEFRS